MSFALLLTSVISHAQVRAYNLVYSDNIKGGTAMFGNTLLNIVNNGSVNTYKNEWQQRQRKQYVW